jgi:hypothetical protein
VSRYTRRTEIRECLDDGAMFAILLAPMVASAMLHASLSQLATDPDSPLPLGWRIEQPLVLLSTPIRDVGKAYGSITDTVRAISALATSRRNLVQLCTLLSFVLMVQLMYSRRHGKRLLRSASMPAAENVERDSVDSGRPGTQPSVGQYWLRRGELRRNGSVIGFAFIVTAGCIGVKAVTAYVGRGVWSGE